MSVALAVDLAKLAMAEMEIQKALATYRQAVNNAKAAAEALCADWEGDAAQQFEHEQANAYKWHVNIFDVITAFMGELTKTIQKYQEAQDTIKALIQQK